jgi:hypothetical protein
MLNDYSKLSSHLSSDLFNSDFSGDTLYIIDDYNIDYNMSDNTLDEFVNAISNVDRIKNVYIFIQKKSNKLTNEDFLFNYNPRYSANLESSYRKKLRFIKKFQNKQITCAYVIYPKFNVRPPFHGRYWLSRTGGFIVDGSLNTVESRAVLVQVMDDENFNIVSNMANRIFDFNNDNIESFDAQRIEEAFETLKQNQNI